MVYPVLLPLIRTSRLPVFGLADAPADLNGLVRFAERRNLVSARVPSHFKRSLLPWERHRPPIYRSFRKWRREGRGEADANYRGPGARLCCICCRISRQYYYPSTVPISSFSLSPSHSATESQFFRFCMKTFSLSALAGGPEKSFFFFTGARTRFRRPWLQEETLSLGE
jgi:hypothetical protein